MLPTLLFVHGAWHSGKAFSKVIEKLQSLPDPYTCIAPDLPSTGSPENSLSRKTRQPDIDLVHSALVNEIEKGNKVLLILHSYGALPGYEALEGIEPGKVEILIICGFLVDKGNVLGGSGHRPPLWNVQGDIIYANDPVHYFYHDAPPGEQTALLSGLKHQTLISQTAPVSYAGWKDVPVTYVIGRKDVAVPLSWQKRIISDEGKKGVKINVIELDSAHSPFITIPDETVQIIVKAAESLES